MKPMESAPDPLGVSDAPLRIEMPTASEVLAKRAAAEKAFKRAADPFAGLDDGAAEPTYSSPTSFKFAAHSQQPAEKAGDMFEALGPTPAPTPAPAAKPADGEFVKADFEKFADGGEIIERETLYSTSSGWKVQKRVVLKSGRERTVITCPGVIAVI